MGRRATRVAPVLVVAQVSVGVAGVVEVPVGFADEHDGVAPIITVVPALARLRPERGVVGDGADLPHAPDGVARIVRAGRVDAQPFDTRLRHAHPVVRRKRKRCPSLVALGTPGRRPVKERERVGSESPPDHVHHVRGLGEAGCGTTHGGTSLEAPGRQPRPYHGEAFAAVVVLQVIDDDGPPQVRTHTPLGPPVAHARKDLGQVDGGVGVVVDSQQQHLAARLVHPTHRTLGAVRRNRKRVHQDPPGQRPLSGEGLDVGAPVDAGQRREGRGQHAQIRGYRARPWFVRRRGVGRPGRHDQGAFRSQGLPERLDEPDGAALDGAHCAERGVYEEDASLSHADAAELVGQAGDGRGTIRPRRHGTEGARSPGRSVGAPRAKECTPLRSPGRPWGRSPCSPCRAWGPREACGRTLRSSC